MIVGFILGCGQFVALVITLSGQAPNPLLVAIYAFSAGACLGISAGTAISRRAC